MHPLTTRAREVLDRLTAAFDTPDVLVDTLAKAALIPNISPCAKWSPANRLLVALNGTSDSRGYRQWMEVGRHVVKGARSFDILVPRFRKMEEDGKEEQKLLGFVSAPVFRFEDTDGEPLPETVPKCIPQLQTVADALGIKVTYTGAVSDRFLGLYRHEEEPSTGSIILYTHDLSTYAHELAHALHHRTGKLRQGKSDADKRDNETVAEIAGAVLVNLFEGEKAGRQAIRYVKGYGAKATHLLTLLPEIMTILDLAVSIVDSAQICAESSLQPASNS